ncbi:MAG: class I SAM-dependent methyltransferase [Myxococcota bacterium]|nr:class I SAM-dependent methyltransferase [Myxococcota bacterium]
MSSRSLGLSETVYSYLLDHSLRESEPCRALRAETALMEYGRMQVSPEQGQFMALLVSLLHVKKAVEVGTFTGYSALCVAQALPEDGCLIACDVSEEWTSIGQKYWRQAGVSHKIDLRIGPALETLDDLRDQSGTFDLGFIDADKVNYKAYYERILQLLRPGGLLLIDNVLWGGTVADVDDQEESTCAIRDLNVHVFNDERIDVSMLPIGDGLTLVRKR